FEGGGRKLLNQAVVTLAVAFFRRHGHVQLVAHFLAHQRLFQTGDDVAVTVQIGQRLLPLVGGVDGLTGVVGQGVVERHHLVVCNLHGCPFRVDEFWAGTVPAPAYRHGNRAATAVTNRRLAACRRPGRYNRPRLPRHRPVPLVPFPRGPDGSDTL